MTRISSNDGESHPLQRPFLADKAVPVDGEVRGMTLITATTKETYDDNIPVHFDGALSAQWRTGTLLTKAQETTDDDFSDDFHSGEPPAVGGHPFVVAVSVPAPDGAPNYTIVTEARGETTDDRA